MTPWDDVRMEQAIGQLLKGGVVIASVVVAIGAVCLLGGEPHTPAAFHTFAATPAVYRTLTGILPSAIHFDCRAIIQLGLLLLIATPVARVAFSLAAFALKRDRTYVVVTTIVLCVLLLSVFFEG